MSNYVCLRCGKTFYHKGTFLRHLNNIRICSPILSEKSLNDIKKFYKIDDENKYKCPYCSNKFKTENILINHIKNTCDNANLQIKKDLEILKLKKELNNLKIKNKVNNSELKSFYDSNLPIEENLLENAIKNPMKGIADIINFIHFNTNYSEFNNIRLSNKKSIYIDIYNGKFWEAKEKSNIIHNLIIKIKDYIDDYFENNNIYFKNNYKKFSDNFDSYISFLINQNNVNSKDQKINKDIYNQLFRNIEILMINSQRILKIKI